MPASLLINSCDDNYRHSPYSVFIPDNIIAMMLPMQTDGMAQQSWNYMTENP